jgi:hypothetical protein
MKKLFLLIALAGFSCFANAQSTNYRPFKFDIDLGFLEPSNSTAIYPGGSFTLEPHVRLSNDFAIGFRVEAAVFEYKPMIIPLDGDESSNFSGYVQGSYCLTADYYLTGGGFRPFIGAGAGYYASAAVNNDTSDYGYTTLTDGKFGFFPRIGFEAGHFRLSATYNVLSNNASYTSIAIGAFFGGGRK